MRVRLPGAAFIVGIALISAAALPLIAPGRARQPGRLIARSDSVTLQARRTNRNWKQPEQTAKFRVDNVGGTPVWIKSTRSGCDCTALRVDPNVVPAGRHTVVEVTARPPETGERTVVITLLTDSPVTPEIPLHLRLMGRERRSYLLDAGGDLAYIGDWSPEERRPLTVVTVHPRGKERVPGVACDLAFLKLNRVSTEVRPTTDPELFVRTDTFEAIFDATRLPRGRFRGEIVVTDPWDDAHVARVAVTGETRGPVEAIPPRLILRVGTVPTDAEVVLELRSHDSNLRPTVEPEEPQSSPLSVSEPRAEDDRTQFLVRIRAGVGEVEEGVHNLVARPHAASPESIVVPVMIRSEGR